MTRPQSISASLPISVLRQAACALTIGLISAAYFAPAAMAGFTPPPNRKPVTGHRTTTGTRQGSCVDNTQTAFTLLGPDSSIGQTASDHPKFVWHLPESDEDYAVQFRLLAPNEQGIPSLVHTDTLSYEAGFNKYSLPDSVAALSPNVSYRWQVVVVCDPSYLSRSLSQELFFEVVPASPGLQQALDSATTDVERALAYGESGLWYDAIAQVAKSNTPQAKSVRRALLTDLAATEPENLVFSENILRIADVP